MTHTTEPWHNAPLPEGVSHAVTVPPGRGVGALEAPQDKHGWGPPERNRRRPRRSWELWRPWQVVFHGHSSRNPSTPPKKNSLWKLGGIRSPPGLDTQNSTWQDRKGPPGPDRQDKTAHRNRKPSWAKLGSWGFFWAWHDIRGPHRVPQQPLPRQGGRRLEWPPRPQ